MPQAPTWSQPEISHGTSGTNSTVVCPNLIQLQCSAHSPSGIQGPFRNRNVTVSTSELRLTMRIYLSGPITGRAADAIRSWRSHAIHRLCPLGEVIDPTLAKYDSDVAFQKRESAPQALDRLRHGLLVVRRNRNLIRSCDVVLVSVRKHIESLESVVIERWWP